MAGLGRVRIKKSDALDTILQFRANADLVGDIDLVRGSQTRSEWFREVVEDAIRRKKKEKGDPAGSPSSEG